MKKATTKVLLSLTILPLLFASCASTQKEATVPADNYNAQSDEESDSSTIQNNQNNAPVTQNKPAKKKSRLDDLFTFGNKNDFLSTDVSSVFTKTITGSIKQKKASILINPEKNTAGFGSTYMSAYYITQFNKESRDQFAKAFEAYISDFDNKRLNRKNKKSYRQYGETEIHLDWGTISSSTPNNADGKACLGYLFEKGSPYFTITVYPIHNNYWDSIPDGTTEESLLLKYYFTKAQAKEILDMISEEKIANFMINYTSDNFLPKVDSDSYQE